VILLFENCRLKRDDYTFCSSRSSKRILRRYIRLGPSTNQPDMKQSLWGRGR